MRKKRKRDYYREAIRLFRENFQKHVIYEDPEILVINKPAFIPTTADDYWQFGVQELVSQIRGQGYWAVHRLDMGTTGVLVLTPDPKIERQLRDPTNWSRSQKLYLLVTHKPWEEADEVVVNCLLPGRKRGTFVPASTRFRLVMTNEKYSLATAVLEEGGRKHQIRLHAQEIGYFLAGEDFHCLPYFPEVSRMHERPLLHAYHLSLYCPWSTECLELTAQLPEDFVNFLNDHHMSLQQGLAPQ